MIYKMCVYIHCSYLEVYLNIVNVIDKYKIELLFS